MFLEGTIDFIIIINIITCPNKQCTYIIKIHLKIEESVSTP